MKISRLKTLQILSLSAALLPAAVCADSGDSWKFGASVYGWFPDIAGTTSYPLGPGGGEIDVPISDVLDKLDFTFQGNFDARKGKWGFGTDVIYLDLGDTQTFGSQGAGGPGDWPYDVSASVKLDMKSWIWTTAGYYRLVDDDQTSFDLLAGVRYADVEQSLDWSISGDISGLPLPGREGGAKVSADYWDAVLGIRGRFALGQDGAWFLPYYFDIGTGDSDFTWQGLAGIGYAFSWGETVAAWRYLSYDLPSNRPIADMDFSGPALGLTFRW